MAILATFVFAASPARADNVGGAWLSPTANNWPLIPLHAVLTPDGRVLTYGTDGVGTQGAYFIYDVWDPSAGLNGGHVTLQNMTLTDIFCSSQVVLPQSGSVLLAGGDSGTGNVTTGLGNRKSNIYANQTLSAGNNMNRARWYSSATVLTNGEVYIQGGSSGGEDRPEVRQLDGNFRLLSNVNTSSLAPWYPRNFIAPDGRVFGYDTNGFMYYVNPSGTGQRTAAGQFTSAYAGWTSSAAMYRPGRILQFGGNSSGAIVINILGGSPVVTATQSMSSQRQWVTATVLADGRVLATGGSAVENQLNDVNTSAEIWDPDTGLWTVGASGTRARLYHSTALLLPDASVLVAGGGAPGPLNNLHAEIYYPPYLFNAAGAFAPRPIMASGPDIVQLGQTFTVGVDAQTTVSRVALIKTGSVTHSFNMDQRFLELPFTASSGTLFVQAPSSVNEAPPGYYLLFVIDSKGVPSIGRIVRVPITGSDTQAPTVPTGLSASAVTSSSITLSWSASTDNVGVTGYEIFRSGTSVGTASVTTTFTDNQLAPGTTYLYSVAAFDGASNKSPQSGSVSATTLSGSSCPCSAWSSATVPAVVSDPDSAAQELGVKFRSSVSGYVTGIRFYKGSANTGTHVGNLWSSTGTRLATATFTNETVSGWQTVTFATPVAITANTVYVASYFAPNGRYSVNENYFATSGVTNGPLYLLRDGESGGNGLYAVRSTSGLPSSTYRSSNYWVDVLFVPASGSDTTAPAITGRTPAGGTTGVPAGTTVTATFSEALDPATINSSTFELRDAANALVPAAVSYVAATLTATLTPSAPLTASATYTATFRGGATDPRVKDVAGNALAASSSWSFTVAAAAGSCPCSAWSSATVPAVVSDPDSAAQELGVKFRSSVSGYVTGIRFYKGSANTGTHVGNLWSSTGTRLATATFTNETASGWQTVTFATPVAITANTVYVASYFAPNGRYSVNENYFATSGVTNGPLYLLRNGESGGNGLYAVRSTSGLPSSTWNASNYWVDVVFVTSAAPVNVAPAVTSPGAQTGLQGVAVSLPIAASDYDGDALAFSAMGLPVGLSINNATGLISGTPISAGNSSVLVAVSDGKDTTTATFTWSISARDPLILDPMPNQPPRQVGDQVTYTASARNGINPEYKWYFGDGSETAWSASPTVTHTFSAPTVYWVTVAARDDRGVQQTHRFAQLVHLTLSVRKPAASGSIEVRDGRVWIVNADNDTVSVFDSTSNQKLAEIGVGSEPRTLAISPTAEVWVTNRKSASISVINPATLSIARTIGLQRASQPFGIVFAPDGSAAYVSLEATGRVARLDPVSGAELVSADVGPGSRHLSITADGARLYVSRFITGRLPGEETAVVETQLNGANVGGEVRVLDTGAMQPLTTVILRHSDDMDFENSGSGIPNYLGPAVISPDGASAWVPSKKDNVKRGVLRSGVNLNHQNTVRAISSRIDLGTNLESFGSRIDYDNASLASAVAFDRYGVYMFVALETSREVAVVDAHNHTQLFRINVGRAPQGLAISADSYRLYVSNFMDRTIGVYDIAKLIDEGQWQIPEVATLQSVGIEKLNATVLKGKQLFYDAQDARLAAERYMSCASCHNDGGHDGRVWDLTGLGEGLRNTIALSGRRGGQGFLHWSGNFDEVHDFEGQIRGLAGGTGLMSDTDFNHGTRREPLGDSKAGLSADLDAVAAYLASLDTFPSSPYRKADGSLTADAVIGKSVFQSKNCAQCHSGQNFTDSGAANLRDIGTIKPTSGKRLGGALTGIDTPTLRDVWAGAPFLHDGSAATLVAAVRAHRDISISDVELMSLVAYLNQIDGTEPAPQPPSGTTSVPNVVNLTQAAATTTLTGAGLVVGTVTPQSSATVPSGSVISQNPTAGTSVAAGSAVALVVSTGPAPVSVPNVVNLTQAAATTTLTGAGLVVGTVTPQSSATVPSGSVISQNPTAGTSVAAGSAVALVVSTGPAPVSVPNVVNLTQAAATTTLTGAGLVVGTVTPQSSATVPSGSVISQNPTAGTSVAAGSAVALVVSTGPAPVSVPNVVNLTQAAATTTLTGAGLVVGTVTPQSSATVPSGSVISQNPTAGTSVAAGSAVALVVSTGPAPVSVPNVVNLTQAAATTTLTGAGLVVGTVTPQSSATVPSGSVISQNPTAGTSVAAGSAVALVVSTGPAAGASCPCSLWTNATVPAVLSDPDSAAQELGVKFRSSVSGYVTGIRFYKGSANTGTHVGNLWSSTGTRLATATFTNETASGWQTVTFATPVAITANTVYVASYLAPKGRYAANNSYFATSGFTSGPLYALRNGESGGNGVYRLGASSRFPSSTWNASNYWVDVVFVPQ